MKGLMDDYQRATKLNENIQSIEDMQVSTNSSCALTVYSVYHTVRLESYLALAKEHCSSALMMQYDTVYLKTKNQPASDTD